MCGASHPQGQGGDRSLGWAQLLGLGDQLLDQLQTASNGVGRGQATSGSQCLHWGISYRRGLICAAIVSARPRSLAEVRQMSAIGTQKTINLEWKVVGLLG